MSAALAPLEHIWLEQFFSGRNALHWDAITNRSAPSLWLEQVDPWMKAFTARGLPLCCRYSTAMDPVNGME